MDNPRFNTIAALADSIIYRFGVAIVSLGLGALASPALYGFFASLLIPIGFFQACVEGLIRGSSTKLFSSESSSRLLLNFCRKAAWAASPLLILYSLYLTIKSQYTWLEFALISPLLLTPLVVVNSAWIQRVLQISQKWRLIASRRVAITAVTLPSCLMAIFGTNSLLAAALFMPLTEFLIYLSLRSKLPPPSEGLPVESSFITVRREMGEFIPFQARFWMITQSDRLVVGLLASAHLSGLYLLASAIARLPGEITTGTLNAILRNKLRVGLSEVDKDLLSIKTVRTLRLLNSIALVSGFLLASAALARVNPELEKIAYLVPLLMSPIFLKDVASVVWTRSIFENGVAGKGKTQTLSILLTLACGVVASQNLIVGAIVIALREILTSTWILWRWRNYASAWMCASAIILSAGCFSLFTFLSLVS